MCGQGTCLSILRYAMSPCRGVRVVLRGPGAVRVISTWRFSRRWAAMHTGLVTRLAASSAVDGSGNPAPGTPACTPDDCIRRPLYVTSRCAGGRSPGCRGCTCCRSSQQQRRIPGRPSVPTAESEVGSCELATVGRRMGINTVGTHAMRGLFRLRGCTQLSRHTRRVCRGGLRGMPCGHRGRGRCTGFLTTRVSRDDHTGPLIKAATQVTRPGIWVTAQGVALSCGDGLRQGTQCLEAAWQSEPRPLALDGQ